MSCEISTYRKTKGKRSTEQVCVCKQLASEMSRTEILVASSCIDMTDKYRPQNQTTSPVRRSTTTNNYALLKIHQPLTSVRVWHGNVQAYSLRFPAEFIQTPPPLPPQTTPTPHAPVFALICTFNCQTSHGVDASGPRSRIDALILFRY